MTQPIEGIWTALVTPFNKNNELDLDAARNIIQHQIQANVSGIIPCGTTGESPTLTSEEKKALISLALEQTRGTQVRVIAGTGSNNTAESVKFSKWASDQGVAGVLVVCPYYNKPSQQGLLEHFTAVADAVECEVVLYNVPGRTAVSLSTDTIVELAKHPKITALKEATADLSFASEILNKLKAENLELQLLSGDDPTLLPFLSVGGVGAISVVSNLIPKEMVAMDQYARSGNLPAAREIHLKFSPLFRGCFVECNPVPIKFAMSWAGFGSPVVRPPPCSPSGSERRIPRRPSSVHGSEEWLNLES